MIVDLALKFSSTVREIEVLSLLGDAVKNGRFGDFNVSAITGTRDTETPTTMATTPDSTLPLYINLFCWEFVFLFFRCLSELSNSHVAMLVFCYNIIYTKKQISTCTGPYTALLSDSATLKSLGRLFQRMAPLS